MADNTWNDANNNQDGGDPGNWSLGHVPTGAETAVLDGTTVNNCTLTVGLSCGELDRQDTYNGIFDADTFNVTTTGAVTLAGATGSVKMGDGQWECGGDFDFHSLTDLDCDTSHLTMTGNGTVLNGISSSSHALYDLTISVNAATTIEENVYSLNEVRVHGDLVINSSKYLYPRTANMYVESGATVIGAGRIVFNNVTGGTGLQLNAGLIDVDRIQFNYFDVTSKCASGDYGDSRLYFGYQSINKTLKLSAGAFSAKYLEVYLAPAVTAGNDCTLDVSDVTTFNITDYIRFDLVGTGNIIIDNSGGSPDWTIGGKVYLGGSNGGVIWTKGGGSITHTLSANETIDYASAQTFENLIFAGTNNAVLTFAHDWTADSFDAESGHFDPNGLTLETVGDCNIREGVNPNTVMSSVSLWDSVNLTVGGTFTVWGSPADQCNMQGDGGWTLNVAVAGSANNVIVSGSNAATGVDIYAKDSTDGGDTTNWVFWETHQPLVVGESGTVQQLQTGDGLNVGGYDLPNTLSSDGKVLLTVNSEAVWAYASHTDITDVSADQHHNEAHTIASHNDTTATGAELETLTDGSDATTLHVHDGSDHDIADHNDTTATGAELETLTDGSNADSLHEHTYAASPSGNVTYYIATSGNDTTGNGSIASPWKTLDKPLEVLYDTEFQYHTVATIELADGTYEHREQLILDKAPSLVIQGNSVLAYTINSVNAVIDNDPSYDAQLTVNTTVGMSAGLYLGVTSATTKKYLNGGWEIISVDDGTHVTVRIESPLVAVAVGAVTATAIMPSSVLEMLDSVGLNIKADRLQLTGLTILKGTDGEYGILVNGGHNITIGPDVVVNGFPGHGIQLKRALCEITDTYVSDCVVGLYALKMSHCAIDGGACAGCTNGFRARGSYIETDGVYIAGNSGEGMRGVEWSLIIALNSDFYGCGVGVAVNNESLGRVQGDNTFAACTTDRSPATGEGNNNSYMVV